MSIVQGDNGYPIPFIVKKDNIEDLTGAFVEVAVDRAGEPFNKQAVIDDALNGKCHFVLTSSDLTTFGTYRYQWTAYFPDGRVYSGKKQSLVVSDKLTTFDPGTGEEVLVIPFAQKTELETLHGEFETLKMQVGENGLLTFATLVDLQTAYPNGINQPVWITSENSWYYWDGPIIGDTTAPVLTIAPSTGLFNANQTVTMSANETATIYYTLDGSTPTEASAQYSVPLTVSATTTVKAFAKDTAGNVSTVQTRTYTIDKVLPIVTAAPVGGTYGSAQSVALSSNETATIYYTLDGSTPTEGSSVYSVPLSIPNTATLKYFAKDTAGNSSTVQTAIYTITVADTTPPVVTASPVGGTYTSIQFVTLSANESATIYYTIDGSEPTTSSAVYSAPINVDANKTLKYFAKDTVNNSSTVQTQTYTINLPVEDTTPPILTITPAGTFTDTKTVTMSANETATIYYTLDDTDPKTSGTKLTYTVPLTLTETDTIKAYAKDTAGNESAVQTVMYTKQVIEALVFDDFNRADGSVATTPTPIGSKTWSGTAKIISNQAGYSSNTSGVGAYPVIDAGVSDNIEISMDMTVSGAFSSAITGLIFRFLDTSNQYVFGCKGNENTIGVFKFGSTAATIPADKTFNMVGTHTLKVKLIGAVVECYVDDVLQITFNDPSYTTHTKHGFAILNATIPRVDNFTIKSI